jgi:ATP-dependent Lon protease
LFILSYNEANNLDKILLDRIHRIQFHSLKLHEKIEVSKKFLLPKIYSDMGLTDCIYISDEIIEYIIDSYTNEPGVRKLKEIFFELIGYINLKYLKELQYSFVSLPICITKEEIENLEKFEVLSNCPICMEETDKNIKLNCNHIFCSLCIEKWLLDKSNTCPTCRVKVK